MKTSHRILSGLLIIVFSTLFTLSASAWGSTGHRAIAQIAWQQLSDKNKSKIEAILGDSYLPLFATWADDIRSEKDYPLGTIPHYVNMPLGQNYEDSQKNEKGDLVTILNGMLDQFHNPKSTTEEKAVALKIIIHLIGDLHQPMHIGLAEDLGGNTISVKWFNEDSNLHKVWDEDIIDNSRLSYTELARFAGQPSEKELQQLEKGGLIAWVDETHQITQTIYDNLGNKHFSYEYYYMFSPVVLKQIQKAGYRLGYVLNKILDGKQI
ncbi:S1/P1 nuclease [Mangrovibacterium diazotrophicum]|uniref:S1/P1 nuclease n=1 Tax=Mangrovibacterium diazotrophicum TaxID=1261403 RepID=A0A419W3Q5_9BACT|nr:S1/P1 nuclease [Mangrovibacterium diazotrophicum]RKD90115.1 S1/P1 nuclease [Mangrovibacterium diazotrophicum]